MIKLRAKTAATVVLFHWRLRPLENLGDCRSLAQMDVGPGFWVDFIK